MRAFLATLIALTATAFAGGPSPVQRVWSNDEAWTLAGPKSYVNPLKPGLAALYVIAPVFDAAIPIGRAETVAHDYVAKPPPTVGGAIEVGGRVLLVTPGPAATAANTASRSVATRNGPVTLLYAADTNGNGGVEPLTSHFLIERAIQLRLAMTQNADVAFFSKIVADGP